MLKIHAGVFHPKFFFSTKFLLNYLQGYQIKDTFLELGAGNGLISISMAKNGAIVTASDINSVAVNGLIENAAANAVSLTVLKSDLFDDIPLQKFDVIAINPPYYKATPLKENDHAWYAGQNYEYFEMLFAQIRRYMKPSSRIIMVLSQDCDIIRILEIAIQNHFQYAVKEEKKFWWEKNYIYEFSPSLYGFY
jgi:release factor glutamine methyltransferase